jgi:iron complex transport system substrate-binding protein
MAPRFRLPLVGLVVLIASACAAQAPAPAATTDLSGYPLTLTDDAGRTVTIEAEPERVVSLAPSNTEIVCALDACERLVGVTDFDAYPPEVAEVTDVVIGAQVDVERIAAAEPDLVLAAGNELTPSSVIAQLEELGYPVLSLYPESIDEIYADIGLVGEALGTGSEAETLVADMRARVDAVADGVEGAERPRTFYEVSVFEGTIYAPAEGSFVAALIELAGAEPISGEPVTGAIALEELVAADPELILLGDASYDPSLGTPDSALAAVRSRPGWEGLTAVVTGRVVPYLDDIVTTRPGPRIVGGLEALARAIHPDRFE